MRAVQHRFWAQGLGERGALLGRHDSHNFQSCKLSVEVLESSLVTVLEVLLQSDHAP